jgi:hypothetical protein
LNVNIPASRLKIAGDKYRAGSVKNNRDGKYNTRANVTGISRKR